MSARYATKEQIELAVKGSNSKAEVLRKLQLVPVGGNYKILTKYLKLYNINYDHFTGQRWRTGSIVPIKKKIPLKDILIEYSNYQSHKLRIRLIAEGLKEHKCEQCLNSEWQTRPIPLELHHINGINTDHRLENLKILCPNCHNLTNNYSGKNKQKITKSKKSVNLNKI